MQVPFAAADHEWHFTGSQAADSAGGDGTGCKPGCTGGRSDECALEAGGAAESAGKPGARERTTGQPPTHQALVDKIIERRRKGVQPINGTPRTIETLLRFGDFQCYPTMFPRVYPNGDVFYPCEPLRKVAGNLLRDGSLRKIFARGKKIYGDIPPCQGICYLFGNVLSHYYVNDFWGLAGDFIR